LPRLGIRATARSLVDQSYSRLGRHGGLPTRGFEGIAKKHIPWFSPLANLGLDLPGATLGRRKLNATITVRRAEGDGAGLHEREGGDKGNPLPVGAIDKVIGLVKTQAQRGCTAELHHANHAVANPWFLDNEYMTIGRQSRFCRLRQLKTGGASNKTNFSGCRPQSVSTK